MLKAGGRAANDRVVLVGGGVERKIADGVGAQRAFGHCASAHTAITTDACQIDVHARGGQLAVAQEVAVSGAKTGFIDDHAAVESVVACAADDAVSTFIAEHGVVAQPTAQSVVACATAEQIVARAAVQRIIARQTRQGVVPCRASEGVVACGTCKDWHGVAPWNCNALAIVSD